MGQLVYIKQRIVCTGHSHIHRQLRTSHHRTEHHKSSEISVMFSKTRFLSNHGRLLTKVPSVSQSVCYAPPLTVARAAHETCRFRWSQRSVAQAGVSASLCVRRQQNIIQSITKPFSAGPHLMPTLEQVKTTPVSMVTGTGSQAATIADRQSSTDKRQAYF